MNLNESHIETRIFIPEYVNAQKQIFDIVYQYSNKFSSNYKIKYEEITDDDLILDVRIKIFIELKNRSERYINH